VDGPGVVLAHNWPYLGGVHASHGLNETKTLKFRGIVVRVETQVQQGHQGRIFRRSPIRILPLYRLLGIEYGVSAP